MVIDMLSERQKNILKAIIDDYIETVEPVGSSSVMRKYNLGVSSATIRNEMGYLEEAGYITQPYTSAGRVPSQEGYRYYVDSLMPDYYIDNKVRKEINKTFSPSFDKVEEIVKVTSKILSSFTNYTIAAYVTPSDDCIIKTAKLVFVNNGKAIAIVVVDSGNIISNIIDIPIEFDSISIDKISNYLNIKLKNKHVMFSVFIPDVSDSKELNISYSDLVKIIENFSKIINVSHEKNVYLNGTSNIFKHPEFFDIETARNLIELLDKNIMLEQMLSIKSSNFNIRIGNENKIDEIKDCSIVSVSFVNRGRTLASLGVVGPTRMRYSRVVALLKYLQKIIDEEINNILNIE